MIQVTTTDSEIPPKTGSFKTVLQFSSSINVSVRFPVLLPPFLPNVYCCIFPSFFFAFLLQASVRFGYKKRALFHREPFPIEPLLYLHLLGPTVFGTSRFFCISGFPKSRVKHYTRRIFLSIFPLYFLFWQKIRFFLSFCHLIT